MSCKWTSLGKQECLNEDPFPFYAECTEGCSPAVFSPPQTDTVIPLTSLCLVEKSSCISSFLFGFPSDSIRFCITGNAEMTAKTRHHVGKCIADNFQGLYLLQSCKCSAGPHKDTDLGRAGYREQHVSSQNAIPSCAGNRFFPKYNAKAVIAKYNIPLGLYVGLGRLCDILGLRSERRM